MANTREIMHFAKLKQAKLISSDIIQATFEIENFTFISGQFIELTLPNLTGDPRGNRREFTISSAPHLLPEIHITFRAGNSSFKKHLLGLAPGSEVQISGPYGDFVLPPNKGQEIIFLAGGIGITPFLSMLSYISENNLDYKIKLFHSDKGEHPLKNFFLKMENQLPNFSYIPLSQRIDLAILEPESEDEKLFFIAGPIEMVVETKNTLLDVGVSEENIFTDEFTGY